MQFVAFCSNQCKSPFVVYVAQNEYLEKKLHLNRKYILQSENNKQTPISLIPSSILQKGEVLLSSVLMEMMCIQHGSQVQILCVPDQDYLINCIDDITIEISTLNNYPFPSILLSQIESTYSISKLLSLFYANCPITSSSRLLIPLNQTFLQGTIQLSIQSPGIITSSTHFHFSIKQQQQTLLSPQFNQTVTNLLKAISLTLSHSSLSSYSHVNGLVIQGGSGSGKTAILQEIIHLNSNSILLSVNEFQITDPYQFLQPKYNLKLLCLDDVTSSSITEDFIQFLLQCFSKQILVVLATPSLSILPSFLLKENYFNHQLILHSPTMDERSVVIKQLLQGFVDEDTQRIILQHTSGYCYKDIHSLCKHIVMKLLNNHTPVGEETVSNQSIQAILQPVLHNFIPSSLIGFDVRKSSRKLNSVGGYKQQKQQLYSLLSLVSLQPEQIQRFHLTPAAGILLYGPTGCGKSYIIPAVVGELNSYYLYIDCPSLFSKFFSETEANIRQVFHVARSVAPCVVVFDQLEVLAGKRQLGSTDDGGMNERIVTTLLTELDGVDHTNTGITVIGITSDINALDDAIIRPGRLGTHIYMGKPNEEDRLEILQVITKQMPIDQDVCLDMIAKQLDDQSVAQIRAVCTNAAYNAMNDKENKEQTIKQVHFIQSLQLIKK